MTTELELLIQIKKMLSEVLLLIASNAPAERQLTDEEKADNEEWIDNYTLDCYGGNNPPDLK